MLYLELALIVAGIVTAFGTVLLLQRSISRGVYDYEHDLASSLEIYAYPESFKKLEFFEAPAAAAVIASVGFQGGRIRFGLLPEPERNPASLLTSFVINGATLALLIVFGTVAHRELQPRNMELTEIVFPTTPPPEIKVKLPPPPKVEPTPQPPQIAKLEAPRINLPESAPKPDVKMPAVVEKVTLPAVQPAKPQIAMAPQPKTAMAAAEPAFTAQQHPNVTLTHFGDMDGVKLNPNANAPATFAAMGNPYGGMQGIANAPQGHVGSAGFGGSTKSGSTRGTQGKVASAGLPGEISTASTGGPGTQGRVASAGIPGMSTATPISSTVATESKTTPPVLLSHAEPPYTPEARQLKIQGDVVLRVTITTSGEIVVHSVIHGLGHGLDESAAKSASTYKFKPAMQNGQPVEFTTNIIIRFQTT